MQQIFAVFLVLGLLFAALWLVRRRAGASSSFLSLLHKELKPNLRRIRLIERVALTPQHSLHLIALEDQQLLLATSPAGCQALSSVDLGIKSRPPDSNIQQATTC